MYSTTATHQHRLLGTGTAPTARQAPTASRRAPREPSSTVYVYLVQEQHQLHGPLQQHHAEHPRSPPAPDTGYSNRTKCTARFNSNMQSTPPAHYHRIVGTGRARTARTAPAEASTLPRQPTSIASALHPQQHEAAAPAYQHLLRHTATLPTARLTPSPPCTTPTQPTRTGVAIWRHHQLDDALQQQHVQRPPSPPAPPAHPYSDSTSFSTLSNTKINDAHPDH